MQKMNTNNFFWQKKKEKKDDVIRKTFENILTEHSYQFSSSNPHGNIFCFHFRELNITGTDNDTNT